MSLPATFLATLIHPFAGMVVGFYTYQNMCEEDEYEETEDTEEEETYSLPFSVCDNFWGSGPGGYKKDKVKFSQVSTRIKRTKRKISL
jgi:hypothetical protein